MVPPYKNIFFFVVSAEMVAFSTNQTSTNRIISPTFHKIDQFTNECKYWYQFDRPPDLYHTCYTLSGLSIAQHLRPDYTIVIGADENEVRMTHPLYNIPPEDIAAFNTLNIPESSVSPHSSRGPSTASNTGASDYEIVDNMDWGE